MNLVAHAGNTTVGRAARLALLLATLLGLTAMHTLGHTGPHPAGDHVAMSATTACAGDGCGRLLTVAGAGHEHGGMDGWAVCVAVLVAFAVVVLAAMLLVRRRAGVTTVSGRPARSAGPRAPPPRPFGLALATVSVLRT